MDVDTSGGLHDYGRGSLRAAELIGALTVRPDTSDSTNILITGVPGVGKTTLIQRLYPVLRPWCPVGFYTQEIRERGARKGFELTSFDGRRGVLSHVDFKGPFRVGKYGIDIPGFEQFLNHLPFHNPDNRLVMIDEIGKMECFSPAFKRLLRKLLDAARPVVATIARHGGGMIAEAKGRSDVTVYEVTRRNRDRLVGEVAAFVDGLLSVSSG